MDRRLTSPRPAVDDAAVVRAAETGTFHERLDGVWTIGIRAVEAGRETLERIVSDNGEDELLREQAIVALGKIGHWSTHRRDQQLQTGGVFAKLHQEDHHAVYIQTK